MINGIDAYTTYGVSLEDGGDSLMAFPPNKQPVTNKNVTADGASVVAGTAGFRDERTVAVPLHIVANSMSDFLAKRNAFYTAVSSGAITLTLPTKGGETHTVYYIDCNQYTQFDGLARFILNLYEP